MQMNVDKFGRAARPNRNSIVGPRGPKGDAGIVGPKGDQGVVGPQGSAGHGFIQTKHGDFDINFVKIKNCCEPMDPHDAVHKMYVDDIANKFLSRLSELQQLLDNKIIKLQNDKKL